jgi:hypothetical protein
MQVELAGEDHSGCIHTRIEHIVWHHTKNAQYGLVHNDIWDKTSLDDIYLVMNFELPLLSHIFASESLESSRLAQQVKLMLVCFSHYASLLTVCSAFSRRLRITVCIAVTEWGCMLSLQARTTAPS